MFRLVDEADLHLINIKIKHALAQKKSEFPFQVCLNFFWSFYFFDHFNLFFLSFSLQSSPPVTEMDTTPSPTSPPSDLLTTPTEIISDPLFEPAGSQTEKKSVADVISEPLDDFVDLTNNIMKPAADTITPEAKDTAFFSIDEPSDDFVDILGSETEAVQEEVVVMDVTAKAAAEEESEMTGSVTDPPGDEDNEASTATVIDINCDTKQLSSVDKTADPLVDILSDDPLTTEAKKTATIDLFDDEGSDLFGEPRQTKSGKQPQKSLFGDPDEDLFGEPLGATSKKSISKEQKVTSDPVKAAGGDAFNTAKPLQEPADIFSEECVITAPAKSNISTVNSGTNGILTEEEPDIFAGWFTIFICLNL